MFSFWHPNLIHIQLEAAEVIYSHLFIRLINLLSSTVKFAGSD